MGQGQGGSERDRGEGCDPSALRALWQAAERGWGRTGPSPAWRRGSGLVGEGIVREEVERGLVLPRWCARGRVGVESDAHQDGAHDRVATVRCPAAPAVGPCHQLPSIPPARKGSVSPAARATVGTFECVDVEDPPEELRRGEPAAAPLVVVLLGWRRCGAMAAERPGRG
ncbi:MAG: hypothetical protein JXR37_01770, partial [Kiritimatiellae bacterium]|nr:hypothetical protein [Kiritimatiellia bacterium]